MTRPIPDPLAESTEALALSLHLRAAHVISNHVSMTDGHVLPAVLAGDLLSAILRRLKCDVSDGMEATGDADLADGAHSKVAFQNMLGDLIAALEG